MKNKQTLLPKFKAGDRVAERPKASIIPNLRADSLQRIAQYRTQRYGTVVETFVKESKPRSSSNRTSKLVFVRVLWDGAKTPSDHAQMRLCLEAELNNVINEYCNAL